MARELLEDPAGTLRLEGLRWCGELADAAELRERVRRSLLDRDRNVRELARFLARSRCELDPLALYRAELASDRTATRAIALLGLAEATPPSQALDPADEAELERALRAGSTRERAAALEGLGERGFERHRAELFAEVLAPAACVRAAALRAIARHGGKIRPAELEALRPLAELAQKRYASLLRRAGLWVALLAILRLDGARCAKLQDQLLQVWSRRFAPIGGEPSAAERARLRELVPTLAPGPRGFLRRLRLDV